MEPDFSGYATKAGLTCSDGRVIMDGAFKHQDKMRVPLVWHHGHTNPENILGYAILEHRDTSHADGAGVYCYAFFNETPAAKNTKEVVRHGDVDCMSIWANKLVETPFNGLKQVVHGAIREVSLVLSGANPGAKIDYINIAHGEYGDDDEVIVQDGEAKITTGLPLEHSSMPTEEEEKKEETEEGEGENDEQVVEHASADDVTVQDVLDTMDEKQRDVVNFLVAEALATTKSGDAAVQHSDDNTDNNAEDAVSEDNNDEGNLEHQEGTQMNVFEQDATKQDGPTLSHDQMSTILTDAKKLGSLKESILSHADEYGITDINMLFPDAKNLTTTPEFLSRRMEWVAKVLDGTKHSPFAKVKTLMADITEAEARAKGYIKGTRKKEEVFSLLKRTTSPATIYKKQKLDRDDILDITEIDVVNWLKAEMRLMIEEEIARAILVGDGRSAIDPDKVKDPQGAIDGVGIRSILNDDDLYSIKVELAANVSPKDAVKGLVRARTKFRGSGVPTLFVSDNYLTDIMLEEDKMGRPLYASQQALADKIRVKEIVTVDLFDESVSLFAIMVNLQDYTVGTNRGGELTSFEDFDIDFNQEKYLQETRLSGGLTKAYSAVVVSRGLGTLAVATQPSFDGATNTITIPTPAGVSYFDAVTDVEMTGDVVITKETEVEARADAGYYLAPNSTDSWTYAP